MEPVALVVDKLKAFLKSGEDFVTGLIRRGENSARHNPIEILKRLQREAFADLMKLRDRQDKVERFLTFYRASKQGPFREDGTRVRGEVDLMGTFLLMDDLDQQGFDAISRGGIRTGIVSRLIFEATIRQKDFLEAEFIAGHHSQSYSGDVLQRPLSLAKVCYTANVTDWFTMVAIPMGARCRDVAVSTNPSAYQEKGLTDFSCYGPPLLHQYGGSAIGLMVRRLNAVASLAQFVAGHPSTVGFRHCFSTFVQIICQLPRSTKLSLFGLHQVSKFGGQVSLGSLTMPLGILKHRKPSETSIEPSALPLDQNMEACLSSGSVALMLESELDESMSIRGSVQLKNSDPRNLQWAVTMSDSPEDEMGWGLSLSGMIQDTMSCDHFQVEAFIKFNLGERFALQPGLVYLMDGSNQMPALVFRSTWSL
ncbi:hypothetical protein Ancab_006973 [Ancistrocladus abbreviatus]